MRRVGKRSQQVAQEVYEDMLEYTKEEDTTPSWGLATAAMGLNAEVKRLQLRVEELEGYLKNRLGEIERLPVDGLSAQQICDRGDEMEGIREVLRRR